MEAPEKNMMLHRMIENAIALKSSYSKFTNKTKVCARILQRALEVVETLAPNQNTDQSGLIEISALLQHE